MKLQSAALPFRMTPDGAPEILLITSRETRRWILPKGWNEDNVKPHDTAALEAFEEAGVRGRIKKKPIGSYIYEKRMDNGGGVPCQVVIYPLKVTEVLNNWPEKAQRERRWVSLEHSALLVSEPGLVKLLQSLIPPDSRYFK